MFHLLKPVEIPCVENNQASKNEQNQNNEDLPDCVPKYFKDAEFVPAEWTGHEVLSD